MRQAMLQKPGRRVAARVAFPGRCAPISIPPPARIANPTLARPDDAAVAPSSTDIPASLNDTTTDVAAFRGFNSEHIETLDGMAALLRRNQVLNLIEGVLAGLALYHNLDFSNSFDTSERALYIVSCLANAFCLRCALTNQLARASSTCWPRTLWGHRLTFPDSVLLVTCSLTVPSPTAASPELLMKSTGCTGSHRATSQA